MRRFIGILLATLAAAPLLNAQARVAVFGGPPQGRRMIWVLSPDNKMSEYDAVQFRVWVSGVALPPEARRHPENIFITSSGIVMYADVVPGTTLRHVWSTNRYANELIGGADDRRPAAGGGFQVTSATPAVYAAADGQRLFWFEDHFLTVNRAPTSRARAASFPGPPT